MPASAVVALRNERRDRWPSRRALTSPPLSYSAPSPFGVQRRRCLRPSRDESLGFVLGSTGQTSTAGWSSRYARMGTEPNADNHFRPPSRIDQSMRKVALVTVVYFAACAARWRFGRLHRARGDRHRRRARAGTSRGGAAARARRSVVVNVRDAARAEQVARAIGERRSAVPADVAAPDGPDSIVRQTLELFGRIDILINNAALPLTTRFERISAEEWRRALEVNLTAPFLLMQAVAADDEGAGLRPHREHLVDRRPHGQHAGRRALHRVEDGTARPHARGRQGTREVRHHRECGLSGHDRHRTHARERLARRARATREGLSRAAARHGAGSRRPDLFRRVRTAPATSPARRWTSTAATS